MTFYSHEKWISTPRGMRSWFLKNECFFKKGTVLAVVGIKMKKISSLEYIM